MCLSITYWSACAEHSSRCVQYFSLTTLITCRSADTHMYTVPLVCGSHLFCNECLSADAQVKLHSGQSMKQASTCNMRIHAQYRFNIVITLTYIMYLVYTSVMIVQPTPMVHIYYLPKKLQNCKFRGAGRGGSRGMCLLNFD